MLVEILSELFAMTMAVIVFALILVFKSNKDNGGVIQCTSCEHYFYRNSGSCPECGAVYYGDEEEEKEEEEEERRKKKERRKKQEETTFNN